MRDLGVTIEAEFKVAEYDIVILSAKDSGGLDKWLRKNDYNIPKGANEGAAALRRAETPSSSSRRSTRRR